jgi:pantothenate kinase type III
MMLAADAGNTAIKLAPVVGDAVGPVRRLAGVPPLGLVISELRRALEEGASPAPEGSGHGQEASRAAAGGTLDERRLLIVSVVPVATDLLLEAARALDLPAHVVEAPDIPLPTHLTEARRTGPDRILGAWTARELYGRPVVVISLGTATTVDGVDAEGILRGGAILPGLGMAAHALAEGTALLPRIEPELPPAALGTDTRGAMLSGVVIGHLGAVRELVARMTAEMGAPHARTVVTGGFAAAPWARAAFVEPGPAGLPAIADVIDPHLLLCGLGRLGRTSAALGRAGPLAGTGPTGTAERRRALAPEGTR